MHPHETTIVEWIDKMADFSASPSAFALAGLSILFWSVMGSGIAASSGWQVLINILSNAGTFLIVFLIQNSQKRARLSLEQKIDELLLHSATRPLTAQDVRLIVEAEMPRVTHLRDCFIPPKAGETVLH